MDRNVSFIGLIGLVIFLFGLFTAYFISHDPFRISLLHLLIGGILVFYFVIKALLAFALGGGKSSVGLVRAKRVAGFGLSVTVYSSLFVGILVLANYFASRHDPIFFDSTEHKIFTLAPQTKKVLNALPHPIIIRAFYVGARVDAKVKELLDRVAAASEKVHWQAVDPEKAPGLIKKFGINEKGTLHFSFAEGGATREAKIVRNITEQEVVNAILKLTRGGDKKVYWISGHGESNLDEETEAGYLFLKEAIQGENIKVEKLNLSEMGSVPEDATALMLMGPRRELLPLELKMVETYLARGGNALFLNEPRTTSQIADLVAPYGIEVGDDIVLDQVVELFAGPTVGVQPVITTYGKHAITDQFGESIVLSTVSSVRRSASVPSGGLVTELAFTSLNSWAEKKVELVFGEKPQAAKEAEDIIGPVSVSAAYEGPSPADAHEVSVEKSQSPGSKEDGDAEQGSLSEKGDSTVRIVVIGDADFLANINIRQLFNRDLFLNALNWVVGEDQGVAIRERTLRQSTKGLTAEQFRTIFLTTAVFVPELLLLWGFSVWWYRNS